MRLLHRSDTGDFSLTQVSDDAIPPYAILSHTWGADGEEVTFDDLSNGTGKDKPGYNKIWFCSKQAAQDGLGYFWIDTCCINKANKAEFSQAINSMFRWYRNATRCYVYLSDVSSSPINTNEELNSPPLESDLSKSKWFTRGWTLQELLAPSSVEFFSREGKRFGTKSSLEQQIHEITGIPGQALQGAPLSQFSVNERLSWIEHRQTKFEEDKAYSLLGIFDVYIPPIYGEGKVGAYKRLMDEIDKLETCIRDLRLTDPEDDKKRIEDTKGGLLKESYGWILENSDFQRWRDNQQSRLLWIMGDPGKGKTMVLCGIIDELKKSMAKTNLVSYFFCQATDSRINNATAVLRGLLYMLVSQQSSLISHIRKKHGYAGKALFQDSNAWVALSEIFTNILQDPSLNITYLVIDALDECVTDLRKLLDFIVQKSCISSRVKWIVSSRNWPDIEESLDTAEDKVTICLELNTESISLAVRTFIQHKVTQLAQRKKYNSTTRDAVLHHLYSNANETFLWVALVCQTLENIPRWKTLEKLNMFPPGLDSLYRQMMQRICNSDDADLYRQVLATAAIAYRPITLQELTSLVAILEDMADNPDSLREIVGLCGSFLTIRSDTIYFVHQSAKDYMFTEAIYDIFPSGLGDVHHMIFSRSLRVMSRVLRRDIYSLQDLAYPAEQVQQPDPDPLATSHYSCTYWVDHLCDWNSDSGVNQKPDLQDGGIVHEFMREKYIYWLEAICLSKKMSHGVVSMGKLEIVIRGYTDASALTELIHDACRFIAYHKSALERSPLQAYASALLFSPTRSLIRSLFEEEAPKCIKLKPSMRDEWGACLQTLDGFPDSVTSVAFSPNGSKFALGLFDRTVRVWDMATMKAEKTLVGHLGAVRTIAFSPDGSKLASGSVDKSVRVWDTTTGQVQQMLKAHSDSIRSVVYSPDGRKMASGSFDKTVRVWNVVTGKVEQTFNGHSDSVTNIAFAPDGSKIVSGSFDTTARAWNIATGHVDQIFEGHLGAVTCVAFSPNGNSLVSGSNDQTIRVWNVETGQVEKILEGHSDSIRSLMCSPDGDLLASGSFDNTIKLWNATTGQVHQILSGHSDSVSSVSFSSDGSKLLSGSNDRTVRVWDIAAEPTNQIVEGHSGSVTCMVFSPDGSRLASGSNDTTVRVWSVSTGQVEQTLKGHSTSIRSVVFSPDGNRLASTPDGPVAGSSVLRVWDVETGQLKQKLDHHGLVTNMSFSPNGRKLVSKAVYEKHRLWNITTGQVERTLEDLSDAIGSLLFSPDGSKLADSDEGTVRVWSTATGEVEQTLECHSCTITCVVFSSDGNRLAVGSDDQTVRIWNIATGKVSQILKGQLDSVSSLLFSPDESKIAAGSGKAVQVWNLATGRIEQIIEVCSGSATDVVFSPEGRILHSFFSVDISRYWATQNNSKILYLPADYRPGCIASKGGILAIGATTGWVVMCSSI